jgi:D-aminopeptidase
VTIIQGENVRTGVTAIVPHKGNVFQDKVAAAVYVYNAFGKLIGSTQVNELGQLETPILLTNTLSVWDAAASLVEWMLALPGNQKVLSINPVVGETNDGWLNDIRGRHVKAADVVRALESAHGGPVEEGSVGAGTGTMALEAGREASVRVPAGSRPSWVGSRLAFWSNQISARILRWTVCQSGVSSAA